MPLQFLSGLLALVQAKKTARTRPSAARRTRLVIELLERRDTPGVLSINTPGDQTNYVTDTVSLALTADDTYGGTEVWAATGLPGGITINSGTGDVSGTVSSGDNLASPYSTTFQVTDGVHTAYAFITWTVNANPVVVASPGAQTNFDGDTVDLPVSATDSRDDSLTFSSTGLPSGLSINSSTGAITGTISGTANTGSPYTADVTASDGTYSNSQTFTWHVKNPVTLFPVPTQLNFDEATIALSSDATDVTGSTLTYSATGLPSGLSIDSSTGVVSGTVASDADASSPFSATITAGDGTYSASRSFTWYINSHTPAGLATPGDQSNMPGDTVDLATAAIDSSTSGETFSAEGLPSGLSIASSGGDITGTVSNGDPTDSPYTVVVSCYNGASTSTVTFFWFVNPVVTVDGLPTQSTTVSQTVSLQVTANDALGNTLTYSASGLPPGLSIDSSSGLISGSITAAGVYSATVTASDGTYSGETTFTWNANLITLANPGDKTNAVGDSVSLSLAATTSTDGSLSFTASGLPDGLSINSSTGVISGTVATDAVTTTPDAITVTVTDGTNTASQQFLWKISTIKLSTVLDQSNFDGDTVSLTLDVSYHGDDTVSFSASGLPSGLSINSSTGVISGTVSSGDDTESPYSVTITATAGTATATHRLTWFVGNADANSEDVNPIVSGVFCQYATLQEQVCVADELAFAIAEGAGYLEGAYVAQVSTIQATATQLYTTINNELNYYTRTAAIAGPYGVSPSLGNLRACRFYVGELESVAECAGNLVSHAAVVAALVANDPGDASDLDEVACALYDLSSSAYNAWEADNNMICDLLHGG